MTNDPQMEEARAIDHLLGDRGQFWIAESIQESVDRGDIASLRRLRRVATLLHALQHRH